MWLLINWIAQKIKYLKKQTQKIWKTTVYEESFMKTYELLLAALEKFK